MFRQYTDATYKVQAPRPDWLGFLGPILRAEVDDAIVVHLKNFAKRNYSMHPHGVFYEKDTEGTVLHNAYPCINRQEKVPNQLDLKLYTAFLVQIIVRIGTNITAS